MNTVGKTPSSTVAFRGFIPYLFVTDAGAMSDWYARVFGFVERSRWTGENGIVENVEMAAGDGELWLDGGQARPAQQWIGVWVDDVEAMYARVREEAGQDVEPPIDRPWGVRELTVTDPEGYQWGFLRRHDTEGSASR